MKSKTLRLKEYWPSAILTIICVTIWLMGKKTAESMAVSSIAVWQCIFLYHFAHANIFHLICNLMALWPFRPRPMTVLVAFLCSSASALILMAYYPGYGPVCGLSAMLFACFARRYATWKLPIWKIVLLNVAFIFIPRVDGLLHLLSFFLSYAVWKVVWTYAKKQP